MTCAIVDAYGAGRLLPAALNRRGIDYVHVRSPFPDMRLFYRPGDFATDIVHTGDVASTACTLSDQGVDYVVAGAESGVLLADELSSTLGVPGHGMRRSIARRDKFEMQQAVRAAGLATTECFRSASADEIIEWVLGRNEWPVVLKPVLSAGADNVIFCQTKDEVVTANDSIMSSDDRYGRRNEVVLAQGYLAGAEYYVNSVSRDGVHRIVEVWRYHKRIVDGRSVYDYEDLVALEEPDAQEVVLYVRAVLDALEIWNGAGHTEVMLTEDGPFLIECGARLGGGQMPELLNRCVGADQVDTLAYSIADRKGFVSGAEVSYQLKSRLRCVNLISASDGTVPSEDGWDPVKDLQSFAGMVSALPPKSRLSRTLDMATCPGTVYLSSDDLALLDFDYRRLREVERNVLYR
ncbi:MAG: ATP-grasp domain-containing protein [Actinobacteria bacterium]|nr:ATP-grasp domain-containing protein [Actinomycetota bacterium]